MIATARGPSLPTNGVADRGVDSGFETRFCVHCGIRFVTGGREFNCAKCKRPQLRALLKGELRGLRLRDRERELIKLRVTTNFTNKEIALQLGLVEGTIKVYLSRAYAVTGVTNRLDLIRWAITNGLVTIDEFLKGEQSSETTATVATTDASR